MLILARRPPFTSPMQASGVWLIKDMVTHFIPKSLFKEVESCRSYTASDPTVEANNSRACPSSREYRAVQRAWVGVGHGPHSWASCWLIPESMPASLPLPGARIWAQPHHSLPARHSWVFWAYSESHSCPEKNTKDLLWSSSDSNEEHLDFSAISFRTEGKHSFSPTNSYRDLFCARPSADN